MILKIQMNPLIRTLDDAGDIKPILGVMIWGTSNLFSGTLFDRPARFPETETTKN